MHESSDASSNRPSERRSPSVWRIVGWLCAGTIGVSVLACVGMAAVRSNGLTRITVTALNPKAEPQDANLPFVKRKEALPDYELILMLANGTSVNLGAKPDTSAAEGLTWQVADPVSVADVVSVKLQERDVVLSDAIAEVQIQGDSVTGNGYRFDFVTEHSVSVGVNSFFGTPIGKAIVAGFVLSVLLIVLAGFFL
jgi:hypothetical protein